MRRVAAAILHDDDLAADAVQETFVRLWHRRWRLGLMKNPQGFCMQTLKNHCIDIIRTQSKKVNGQADEYATMQDDNDGDNEELYGRLEVAIATLPPQQQRLIEMKYIEHRSIREIAELTGLSETNITTNLSRAYKKLKNKLEE